MSTIRNIAIIAHVDHGKTTLVDSLFQQTGAIEAHKTLEERAMDSNALEKERGITILAKCTSIAYKDHRINIIDTPGHADFGGEVERILSMVDGVILLVDAKEGPMPQTKFVLSKALNLGLKPIVIINKVDRGDAEAHRVLDECFDLFIMLGATDDQLDFPYLYAVGRDGWCSDSPDVKGENLLPLLDLILDYVPEPNVNVNDKCKFLVSMIGNDAFVGRILTGRIESGKLSTNQMVKVLSPDGDKIEEAKLTKLFMFKGLERVPCESAQAGDIVAIAGLGKASVADTICDLEVDTPLKAHPIDPPTMSITIHVNNSPLSGLDGDKVTSRIISDRLFKEAETNVAISVTELESKDSFQVHGRGELQLGVLIETMRREGFELGVSRPKVVYQTDANGGLLEPQEEVVIEVDESYSGTVIDQLTQRKGQLQSLDPQEGNKVKQQWLIPTRGLIGFHSILLTATSGSAIMHRLFHSYIPKQGEMEKRTRGVLIATDSGDAVAYALYNLQDRGELFIPPGQTVYQGMIIGEHSRDNDLEVNVQKGKQLSNVRASGKDDAVKLSPPRLLSLENMIAYIADDEMVEVTPNHLRMRKIILDPVARKRSKNK